MVFSYNKVKGCNAQTLCHRSTNRDILFNTKTSGNKAMNVEAIIEKSVDGLYAARSESKIGRSYFGGFGDNVDEAKEDFFLSIHEAIEDAEEQGLPHPLFDEVHVTFTYDIPSLFNCFDMLNTSKFASYAGINESKMRQYKCGAAYPGTKTTKKILEAIRKIGAELSAVML